MILKLNYENGKSEKILEFVRYNMGKMNCKKNQETIIRSKKRVEILRPSSKFIHEIKTYLRVHFVRMIRIRISDLGSLRSRCVKGTDESTLSKDSSVPLTHRDSSYLKSLVLIRISPKNWSLMLCVCVFLNQNILSAWLERLCRMLV